MLSRRLTLSVCALVLIGFACARADEPEKAQVTEVPAELRDALKLGPFYQKYASAGGIPVLSSDKVSDAGVQEAVSLITQMLADRPDVLKAMVKNGVRFVVMAPTEMTSDVPDLFALIDEVFKDSKFRYVRYDKRNPPEKKPWRRRAAGLAPAGKHGGGKPRRSPSRAGSQTHTRAHWPPAKRSNTSSPRISKSAHMASQAPNSPM